MGCRPTVINLVVDAVGIPTLEYLLDKYSGRIFLPHLELLGLGTLLDERHHCIVQPVVNPQFSFAVDQSSAEADSTVGHREMMGIIDNKRYELFFDGFPVEYISRLEKVIGRKTIFNRMAGGVDAIEKNRVEHEATGFPIVYSSMCDPLIQIAMNEDVIPVKEAHRIADVAFDIAMNMGIEITRSIARTYKMVDGEIVRTPHRHDVVLPLHGDSLLDVLYRAGVRTFSVGKPADLVPFNYWTGKIKLSSLDDLDSSLDLRFVHPKGKDTNPYSIQGAIHALRLSSVSPNGAFIFVNCVDTDSLWGHTQQVDGSLDSLQEVDRCIPLLLEEMRHGDILMVTADHGMLHAGDRKYYNLEGTKFQNYGYHHKERVPLLALKKGGNMNGIRLPSTKTFTAIGHVIAQVFHVEDEYVEKCKLSF